MNVKLFIDEMAWTSVLNLPRNVQRRFIDFQHKFKENPKSPAINLEKIATFNDDSLRTARLDDTYRIVMGVACDNEYCILHVDHHDEAIAWGRNKKFIWNKDVSSFQVISVQKVEEQSAGNNSISQQGAFSVYSDEQLLKIGVPKELLPLVRRINDLDDLDKYESDFPQDAWENLYYLFDSNNIDQIIFEVEEGKRKNEEHEKQLQSENNRRRFIDITEDEDLEKILNSDLKQWMIFLHPTQRKLVDGNYKGSLKVSGGGGTGKTVAAIHRLKLLCTDRYENTGKVLYTAYNKSLIENLAESIKLMQVPSQRYTLCTIDKLVQDIAKEKKIISKQSQLKFDSQRFKQLWEQIVMENMSDFSADFLEREYKDVIMYNDVKSLEQYYKTSRIGQGNALSRKLRLNVWTLVEKYNELKAELQIVERDELFNKVSSWLQDNNHHPFSHVIADEIQDLSNPELRFLRALTPNGPNDLFLVGDPYQRIYGRKLNFKAVGIDIRGCSKRLRVNYRTTEEIKRHAVSVVENVTVDDFDGNAENLKGYVSLLHGDMPEYQLFQNKNQEYEAVAKYVKKCVEAGIKYNDICISAYRNDTVDSIASFLSRNENIPVQQWNNKGDINGVRAYTFHRMKGLEFRVVIIVDVSKNTTPYIPGNYNEFDELQKQQHDQTQRSLMYVALTRAVNRVFITGVGEPSLYLQSLYKKQTK